MVSIAAAAAVLLVFGGVFLLLSWPADEVAVTTTLPVVTSTATTLPVTTSTSTPGTTTTAAAARPAVTPLAPTPPGLAMTWEPVASPAFADGVPLAIVAGGPGLVAVGVADDGYYGDGAVWVSVDGREWVRVPDDAGVFQGTVEPGRLHDGAQLLGDIVAWNEGFVAVGSDGYGVGGELRAEDSSAIWVSADGVAWTRVPDQESLNAEPQNRSQFVDGVASSGSDLVAVGYSEEVVPRENPHLGQVQVDVQFRAVVWSSADGLNWTRLDPVAVEGGEYDRVEDPVYMNDVVAGGPGFVAVGQSGDDTPAVWVSRDGTSWQLIRLEGAEHDQVFTVSRVVAGAHRLAAVGSVGPLTEVVDIRYPPSEPTYGYAVVWMSEDGTAWRRAAVLDAGPMDEPAECTYLVKATTATWYGDTLLVAGDLTTACESADQYQAVWATADFGETWHLIAKQPRGPGSQALMNDVFLGSRALINDVEVFGRQLVAVGPGLVWLGIWQAE